MAMIGKSVLHCERGGVAVLVALTMVVLLGFVALGVEFVFLLATSRNMQSAADSAAAAAATALARGYPADYAQEAFAIAAAAGFTDGQGGTTVTVNSPPLEGGYANAPNAVEVVVRQPQNLTLASLLHTSPIVVGARAVASAKLGGACALVLNGAVGGALSMGGSSALSLLNCDLAVDSAAANAVALSGSADLTARTVSIVGGYARGGNSRIDASGGVTTNAPAVADPYADVPVPPVGPCNFTNFQMPPSPSPASPGVYCNGMTVTGALTLKPGTYIIDRGSLSVGANGSLSGTGVTIVLTSSTGSNYATVAISGGSHVNLTAPATGMTAGLVLFQDRSAPAGTGNSISGGTAVNLTGAIYLPNQGLTYWGGANNANGCTQIIADTLTMGAGSSVLAANCDGVGVRPIGSGSARLVE